MVGYRPKYTVKGGLIVIVQKNQRLTLTVDDVTSDGRAVAKADGYPLFINGAVTGDTVTVTVTKTNKNYGFARLETVDEPSQYRVMPECRCALKCGGCDFMNINYEYQTQLKKQFVIGNMRRIGGISPEDYTFDGITAADEVLNYRNKAQFPVGKKGNTAVCGFYSKRSHKVVPVGDCLIQHPDINRTVAAVLEYANRCKISVYDEKSHRGILRHIYIRRGHKTGDIMAVIVTNSAAPLKNEDVLIDILTKNPNVKSIVQNINTRRTNIILGDKNRVIWGDGRIVSEISGLKFCLSPHSFFQVNGSQTEKLYAKALEYADLHGDETVFDLYCGVGSISLFLARRAKKVVGVEIVEAAVENARRNAELNGIENADFYCGDCADVVGELEKNNVKSDVAVVDPPRKGCSAELIDLLCKMNPEKIVYVSCNSATLARDAALLRDRGYTVKKLCAVDMFPQTVHVETVVLMSRTEK